MLLILFGILSIVAGYLLGSIPTAYIVAKKRKGIDIRNVDVGNVGAGAIFRQVGFREGFLVFVVDAAKGAIAVLIAHALGLSQIWVFAAGFAALLGHCFPVWIGFKGGQGVATLIGVFAVLTPWATLVILAIIGISLLLIRHLFAAIFISAPFLPLMIWVFYGSLELILYSVIIIVFIILKTMRRWGEVPSNVRREKKPDLITTVRALIKRKPQ